VATHCFENWQMATNQKGDEFSDHPPLQITGATDQRSADQFILRFLAGWPECDWLKLRF